MPVIHLVTTGGTIASRVDPQTGAAVPALGAAELVAMVPALGAGPKARVALLLALGAGLDEAGIRAYFERFTE